MVVKVNTGSCSWVVVKVKIRYVHLCGCESQHSVVQLGGCQVFSLYSLLKTTCRNHKLRLREREQTFCFVVVVVVFDTGSSFPFSSKLPVWSPLRGPLGAVHFLLKISFRKQLQEFDLQCSEKRFLFQFRALGKPF